MSAESTTVPYIKVDSVEWRDDYNVNLNKVCAHLWGVVVALSEQITDENGEKINIPVGDLTNTMTQVTQAYRRDKQADEQIG